MGNAAAVIERNSVGKKNGTVFSEKDILKILSSKSQVVRYAYAPVDNGVYTKAEYNDFVKRHNVPTAKTKKPSWKAGDPKPCTWQIVVEYEPKSKSDDAAAWFQSGVNHRKKINPSEFSKYEDKLSTAKRFQDKPVMRSASVIMEGEIDETSAVIPAAESPVAPSFDPFLECAEGMISELLSKNFGTLRAELLTIAKENLRLKEENNILRGRLDAIRVGIGESLEIIESMSV